MSIIEQAIEAARDHARVVVICRDDKTARNYARQAARIVDVQQERSHEVVVGSSVLRFQSVWAGAHTLLGCPMARLIVDDLGWQEGLTEALEPYYEHERRRSAYTAPAR